MATRKTKSARRKAARYEQKVLATMRQWLAVYDPDDWQGEPHTQYVARRDAFMRAELPDVRKGLPYGRPFLFFCLL